MTKQETFDIVKAHLLTQMLQAKEGPKNACRYRTADGLKCAVGCLIPDNEYDVKIEGRALGSNAVIMEQCPSLKEHDFNLLVRLQTLHDSGDPSTWEKKLNVLEEGLNP